MNGKLSYILSVATIILMTACFFSSCGKKVGVDAGKSISADSLNAIKQTLGNQIARSEYDKAIALSERVKNYGVENNDDEACLTGMVYMAQIYYGLQMADSMHFYINRAIELGHRLDADWALASAYNVLGINSMFIEQDYLKGISYLIDGVKFAERSGDDNRLFALKCNLALGYYFRNDPAGLPYALDVYELGRRLDDQYMVFSGAVASGYLYYLSGDYDKALEHIKYAIPLTEIYGDRNGVYSIYGDILLGMGREEEAVRYYRLAMSGEDIDGHYSSAVDAHLSYGSYLIDKNRYAEAIGIMEEGIGLTANNPVKRYLLYRNISAAYDSLGNAASALGYYKKFRMEADSIFNADKERAIGELKVKYEQERRESEVRQHKIDVLNWQKKLQIAILIIVMVLIVAVAGYILNYRKDKNYKSLLKQHQASKDKERWYQQQLEKDAGKAGGKTEYHKSRSSDKMEELFASLQEVMYSQQLYKDTNLSRDKVAGILSTNRTYLTETVNRFTGLSFIYYINSFRIDEAIRLLSDPGNDIPIKALASEVGFSSISTFYKFFQATTEMSPAQFRNNIKNG